jgi:hypothetical protein
VFNVLFNLPDVDDQVRCLTAAAALLGSNGSVVVESFVPDPERLAADPGVSVRRVEPDRVMLSASKVDVAAQRIDASIIDITEAGIRLYPVQVRYASPDELDELAAAAGLTLETRWGGWDRSPFTEESEFQVAIYHRAP